MSDPVKLVKTAKVTKLIALCFHNTNWLCSTQHFLQCINWDIKTTKEKRSQNYDIKGCNYLYYCYKHPRLFLNMYSCIQFWRELNISQDTSCLAVFVFTNPQSPRCTLFEISLLRVPFTPALLMQIHQMPLLTNSPTDWTIDQSPHPSPFLNLTNSTLKSTYWPAHPLS